MAASAAALPAQAPAAASSTGQMRMSWPGCGEFIFWQLGVLKELSKSYNLSKVSR